MLVAVRNNVQVKLQNFLSHYHRKGWNVKEITTSKLLVRLTQERKRVINLQCNNILVDSGGAYIGNDTFENTRSKQLNCLVVTCVKHKSTLGQQARDPT